MYVLFLIKRTIPVSRPHISCLSADTMQPFQGEWSNDDDRELDEKKACSVISDHSQHTARTVIKS